MRGKTKRVTQTIIVLAVCISVSVAAVAFAAPDTIVFETRLITDPMFGGATAATVAVPEGWKLSMGEAQWNFNMISSPAHVFVEVESAAGEALFSLFGPNTALCYYSQSPEYKSEAEQMGRLYLAPMKPEEALKMAMEGDKTISNVKIMKVDKLDGNDAAKKKLIRVITEQLRNGPDIGMTGYQIDEALTYVTFTKNGIAWESVMYNFAEYMTTVSGVHEPACYWRIGPFIAFQTHAGKMNDYTEIFASILDGSKVDPVWAHSVQLIGIEIVKQEVLDESPATTAKRVAQASYSKAEELRTTLVYQSELTSALTRGWTDLVTGADWWSGGGDANLFGVWALRGTGVGYSGGEGDVLVLTLGADGKAVARITSGCMITTEPAVWEADGHELRLASAKKTERQKSGGGYVYSVDGVSYRVNSWSDRDTTYEYFAAGDTLTLRPIHSNKEPYTHSDEKMVLTRRAGGKS